MRWQKDWEECTMSVHGGFMTLEEAATEWGHMVADPTQGNCEERQIWSKRIPPLCHYHETRPKEARITPPLAFPSGAQTLVAKHPSPPAKLEKSVK
eukprot:444228-Amphidinium_carterae.1